MKGNKAENERGLESILYRSVIGKEYFVALKGGASHADMWGKRSPDKQPEQRSRDRRTQRLSWVKRGGPCGWSKVM